MNTAAAGVFEGIPFEYTTSVKRPSVAPLRWLVYLRAIVVLTVHLVRLRSTRRHSAVWLYIMDGPTNLYVGTLCRALGLRMVQELCEWWPGDPLCSTFTRWLYRTPLFRNTTGALVISKLIEGRVREIADSRNPSLRIHRLPAIVDPRRFKPKQRVVRKSGAVPTFVWCGAQEWLKDILFLIRTSALVAKQGYRFNLMIVGTCSDGRRAMIESYAEEQGLPRESYTLTGYVDDAELQSLLQSSNALLLPLGTDDRSKTRMPNKLPEYLASGRPVITCAVGDLTDFLIHGRNAYLAAPGDEASFADQMVQVLRDRAAADRIGKAGQETCEVHLDYRVHARALARFFKECLA
jgi:glycosyltransferase involved in cell wall biosynthesis